MDSLSNMLKLLAIQTEINSDRQELRQLGLTEEEIDGYIEFFCDNWYSDDLVIGRKDN